MPSLRKLVLDNWWLKLLSLGLAFALWLAVGNAPPVEVRIAVPVEIHNLPADLRLLSDLPTHVQVTLNASEPVLSQLSYDKLSVRVDLEGFAAGVHELRFQPDDIDVPPGVQVVRIKPIELRVELVPRS